MAVSIVQQAGSPSAALPSAVTIGNVLIAVSRKGKQGSGPSLGPPDTTSLSPHLGGDGSWTALAGIVTSNGYDGNPQQAATIAIYAKVATTTENNWSVANVVQVYELSGAVLTGVVAVSQDFPANASNLDIGSLGSPGSDALAFMAVGQYTADIGTMTYTATGWTTDQQFVDEFFGNERPYWMGHRFGSGAALEAQITTSASTYPWTGAAVLISSIPPISTSANAQALVTPATELVPTQDITTNLWVGVIA
jgi:hypothetical protein